MASFPDVESLSQEIAQIHLQGDLILDQAVGQHVRRVTIAQILNAPGMGLPNHRLWIGGRECKFVELVANVVSVEKSEFEITFLLDDGYGRTEARLSIPRPGANPLSEKITDAIDSLECVHHYLDCLTADNRHGYSTVIGRPFDYAHIEGKVHRPPDASQPNIQIFSLRRLKSGDEIPLHMLQTLSEIRNSESMDNITAAEPTVEPVSKPVTGELPSPPKQARAKTRSQSKSAHQGPLAEDSALPEKIGRVKTRSLSKQAELPSEGTDSTDPPPKRTKSRKTTRQEPLQGGPPRSDSNCDHKGKSKEPFTPFPVTNLLGASIPSREPPSSLIVLRSPPVKRSAKNLPDALRIHPKAVGSHILRYFRHNMRAATSDSGIAVHNEMLKFLMLEQGLMTMKPLEFKEALDLLVEEGYIHQTIDEFHFALVGIKLKDSEK
ncbi:hypothetical protein DFP72DRAFT_629372 [Ephemerocybe angulata]|uniref:Replication protein A C-terminal domain-containing protein n=1 Tax=Ephemerocybe angulata TaxID=980116 RepID=A0A8H6IAU8_9AGAR|nr:hypothetical protein DFP72DRAFT_629372 [Tulosesus angulatus]